MLLIINLKKITFFYQNLVTICKFKNDSQTWLIYSGIYIKHIKYRKMKLNSKGRYAVMALADLAGFESKTPVSLRDISLRQWISLLYL